MSERQHDGNNHIHEILIFDSIDLESVLFCLLQLIFFSFRLAKWCFERKTDGKCCFYSLMHTVFGDFLWCSGGNLISDQLKNGLFQIRWQNKTELEMKSD